jgi:adenylate cyclase
MRRPRPLHRLIDGDPDAAGSWVARRTLLLAVPSMIVANAIGAVVVAVLAFFVLPTPSLTNEGHVRLVNLVAAGVYVLLALIVGSLWGLARFRTGLGWLREERSPSDKERRMTLRGPLRQLTVNATLWLLGAVVLTLVNLHFSSRLSLMVGLAVLLGGITTCAAAYLLSERIMRPAAARALARGVPERPVLPGVTTRALLAWALGTAVPTLGLIIVAALELGGLSIGKDELALTALGLGVVALTFGLLVTWQSARITADPVRSVQGAVREVEQGNLDAEVPVFDGSELGLLQAGFNRMVAGLREREEMRDLFGRQVGEDVAREALERGIELGGEEREVAVIFVDLTGSTKLASDRPPTEVVSLLNDFFGVVIAVVEGAGGSINKFMGDAALAVFGAPIPHDEAATTALAAARELAERLPKEVPGLEAGIGVSAGTAVAGNIGSETRYEYTVIGDPVNEAARLCDLAKTTDAKVLASADALERASDAESGRWELGEPVKLRGRREETRPATPA